MYDVVGSILPLAVAVALSPFPVIAVVLMLLSERAARNAVAFLAGWILGVFVAIAVLTLVSKLIELPDASVPNILAGGARIVIGLLLLVLAVRKWRSRPAAGSQAVVPRWMSSIATASSGRSLVTGIVLSAGSPKNIAITLAAGVAIGTGGLSTAQLVGAVALYVVVASLSVLIPVLAYAVLAERLRAALTAFEEWLLQNNAAILSILLLVFGFVVIGEGIGSF